MPRPRPEGRRVRHSRRRHSIETRPPEVGTPNNGDVRDKGEIWPSPPGGRGVPEAERSGLGDPSPSGQEGRRPSEWMPIRGEDGGLRLRHTPGWLIKPSLLRRSKKERQERLAISPFDRLQPNIAQTRRASSIRVMSGLASITRWIRRHSRGPTAKPRWTIGVSLLISELDANAMPANMPQPLFRRHRYLPICTTSQKK